MHASTSASPPVSMNGPATLTTTRHSCTMRSMSNTLSSDARITSIFPSSGWPANTSASTASTLAGVRPAHANVKPSSLTWRLMYSRMSRPVYPLTP